MLTIPKRSQTGERAVGAGAVSTAAGSALQGALRPYTCPRVEHSHYSRRHCYQSSGAPHLAAVLTVRLAGSQSVAVGTPTFCVLFAAPTGQRLNFLAHFGSFLNAPHGIGPRDEPSQVLQPIAHLAHNRQSISENRQSYMHSTRE